MQVNMYALPVFHDEQLIFMDSDFMCDDGQTDHLTGCSVPIVILTWRKETLFRESKLFIRTLHVLGQVSAVIMKEIL